MISRYCVWYPAPTMAVCYDITTPVQGLSAIFQPPIFHPVGCALVWLWVSCQLPLLLCYLGCSGAVPHLQVIREGVISFIHFRDMRYIVYPRRHWFQVWLCGSMVLHLHGCALAWYRRCIRKRRYGSLKKYIQHFDKADGVFNRSTGQSTDGLT